MDHDDDKEKPSPVSENGYLRCPFGHGTLEPLDTPWPTLQCDDCKYTTWWSHYYESWL